MITADLVGQIPLFAPLPQTERESLAARAADVRLNAGEWLVQEGQQPAFWALLEGTIDVMKSIAGHDHRLTTYGPGDYFGEVPLLLGSAAVASLRTVEPIRALRLDPSDFRDLITHCRVLSSEIARTMVRRVEALQKLTVDSPATTVTVVGRRTDLACHDVRDFLSRNHVDYVWLDPDERSAAARIAEELLLAPDDGREAMLPAVVLADGHRLEAPSFRDLAHAVGLQTTPHHDAYDVVVVGGGPAGLAAAVYGASEGLRTLLVERVACGGQAGTSSRIENYLGFPAGLSGDELSGRARQQATRFGAELLVARSAAAIDVATGSGVHEVVLEDGARIPAAAIVLATGVQWRRLDVPGIGRLTGRGVYYGAAGTEALGMRGRAIHLVGGGNSAGQAAMMFSNYADSVTMLVRGPSLAASMSQYLIEQLATKANVSIETGVEVVGVEGDDRVEALVLAHGDARERRPSDALFVFIGAHAETAWLPSDVVRDEWGYVCTGRDVMDLVREQGAGWPLARDPYLLETSAPGVFAAGDVRHGSIKRVASGVGEGSMAIAFVHQYMGERRAS